MKTAKEMAHKNYPSDVRRDGILHPGYTFTPSEFKEFCEQICKEQREICAKSFPSHEYPGILEKIINAPEPELE